MAEIIVREEQFPEIIGWYNSRGKKAAYGLIREKYAIRNPGNIVKRIKKCGKYVYDPDEDCFRESVTGTSDNIFIGLDELCGKTSTGVSPHKDNDAGDKASAMEKLVHELISDRLLAMSRYVTMDPSARTILIDQTSLTADGYRIISH